MWQTGSIKNDQLTLHYRRARKIAPSVLMCHGFAENNRCWGRSADVLAENYDVITPDARGHGRSARSAESFSTLDFANDIEAITSRLQVKPHLIGHSMGAHAAAAAAARNPASFSSLVLEDPPWQTDSRPRGNPYLDLLNYFASVADEEMLADARAANPLWHDSEFDPWAEAKRQVVEPAASWSMDWPWQEIIPQVRIPTLVIAGAAGNGSYLSTEAESELQRLNSRVRVVRLPTGHSVRRDAFDDYIALVSDFLASH